MKYSHLPGHIKKQSSLTMRSVLKCPGPKAIKLFTGSAQLSMKFQMLISIMISRIKHFPGSDKPRLHFFPTVVGITTLMSRKNFMLS